jgi:hypothetical protein
LCVPRCLYICKTTNITDCGIVILELFGFFRQVASAIPKQASRTAGRHTAADGTMGADRRPVPDDADQGLST